MGTEQKTQTGAGVIIRINGAIVGFATHITYQRNQNVKPIYEIDSPFAKELAIAGPYSVTGGLSGFRLRGTGGLDGMEITSAATVKSYFEQKYVTIDIVDRLTNKSIALIRQAVFNSESWNISAKSPITFSATFIGVFVANEHSEVVS